MSGTKDQRDDARDETDDGIAELLARRNGLPPPSMRNAAEDKAPDAPDEAHEPPRGGGARDGQSGAEETAARYRRQVEELRNRAGAAEARAAQEAQRRVQAEGEMARSRREGDEAGYLNVVSQIEAHQAQQAELKASFRDAFEKGDADRMSDISARQGAIAARLQTLEDGRTSYEAQRNAKLREPAPQERETRATGGGAGRPWQWGDSPDVFIDARKSNAAKDWLREHPEFFSDRRFFQTAVAADGMAQARDIPQDTRQYFEFVERQLQDAGLMDEPRGNSRGNGNSRADGGSRAPPSIGPGRDVPGRRGGDRDEDIRITAEDRYGAELCRMDPVEYVKEKKRLAAAGEWPLRTR